jgi:hypothetical protein
MIGERYRLHDPTLAILTTAEGKCIPVTVPKNSVVTVKAGPLDGARLIEVEWDREMLMMFMVDLRGRGAPIHGDEN